jgi:hypothetical protein
VKTVRTRGFRAVKVMMLGFVSLILICVGQLVPDFAEQELIESETAKAVWLFALSPLSEPHIQRHVKSN